MSNEFLKIGDLVKLNPSALDEQIESMEDPATVYTVSEIEDTRLIVGTSGQWIKVRDGVRSISKDTNEVKVSTEWIDKAWFKKYENN